MCTLWNPWRSLSTCFCAAVTERFKQLSWLPVKASQQQARIQGGAGVGFTLTHTNSLQHSVATGESIAWQLRIQYSNPLSASCDASQEFVERCQQKHFKTKELVVDFSRSRCHFASELCRMDLVHLNNVSLQIYILSRTLFCHWLFFCFLAGSFTLLKETFRLFIVHDHSI